MTQVWPVAASYSAKRKFATCILPHRFLFVVLFIRLHVVSKEDSGNS